MPNIKLNSQTLKLLVEHLELPEGAYRIAVERYEDLGKWLGRPDSTISDSRIFAQGSFRLGTAIHPIHDSEQYDLDLACKVQSGMSTSTTTQAQLKDAIGTELEAYRVARQIKQPLEAKHRCWRLEYQDKLAFHLDVVPALPASDQRRSAVRTALLEYGRNEEIAAEVSAQALAITDDRHPHYRHISDDWQISNPEGFAKWFESRMNLGVDAVLLERYQQDEIPIFARKTTLQRAVQLLKRHRDTMFQDEPDCKPISVIITTLASRAYDGNQDLGDAMSTLLNSMEAYVNDDAPRIPNPVNPGEDFADKWATEEGKRLKLEENFKAWMDAARRDFAFISSQNQADNLVEAATHRLNVRVSREEVERHANLQSNSPSREPASVIIREPAKPWLRD